MTEYAAKGTVVTWGGTTITGVTSFEAPGVENDTVEVTDLSDAAKTFIPSGSYDVGEATMEVNFDPSTSGAHDLLMDDGKTGATRALIVRFPDAETIDYSASAYVQSFKVSGAIGDKITGSVTFKCSGELGIAP